MRAQSALHTTVEAVIELFVENPKLAKAIKAALSPDNVVTPSDMSIREEFACSEEACVYLTKITIQAEEPIKALLRARSTVDEILAIVNVIAKQIKEAKSNSIKA